MIILTVLVCILSVYFIFYLLYPFFQVLIYNFKNSEQVKYSSKETDVACIITAYKESDIVLPLVDSLLKQNYQNYLIYVVADNCDTSKLNFSSEKVIVLKPPNIIGSKFKSIYFGIENFIRPHKALAIFDSDNLAHPDFLKETNNYLTDNYVAVQGKRKAKNLNTKTACLDSANETYYNFTDREFNFRFGSSSALAGSGMTFEVSVYEKSLKDKKIVGGFDKILQYEVVNSGYRIAFAANAIVYDEKVAESDQVVKQRTRWINSWFKYAYMGVILLFKGVLSFNLNKILFSLMLIRAPLFIIVLSSLFLSFIVFFIDIYSFAILFFSVIMFVVSFLLIMKINNIDERIWKSLYSIPLFIFYQIISLFRIKKANKSFLETKHTISNSIDDILKDEKLR